MGFVKGGKGMLYGINNFTSTQLQSGSGSGQASQLSFRGSIGVTSIELKRSITLKPVLTSTLPRSFIT